MNLPNGKGSNMTVKELYEQGIAMLMGGESPKIDARAILEHLLQIEFGKLPLYLGNSADDISEEYIRLVVERKAGRPLSYITGKKEFFSRNFHVREGVLIPRPETENLVSAVLERLPRGNVQIADLCSGSGCIGITIALESGKSVDLYELSPDAIAISKENAEELGANVSVSRMDVLRDELPKIYDVIVSNPPYIPLSDMEYLMTDVVDYEPEMALTDGADGLIFYRRLCFLAEKFLTDGGILAVEIGINQHLLVADIMKSLGEPEIITDYFGVERVVLVKKGVF